LKRFKSQNVKKYDWNENSFHVDTDVGLAEMKAKSVLTVVSEGGTLVTVSTHNASTVGNVKYFDCILNVHM